MSKQYPGGIISKTAPTPSGSFENSTAPGIWTLEQQAYWQKLGQWPIPGNVQTYIEDVFSTYLFTGTNPPTASQTIVNGINLASKGGLVWTKSRNAAEAHILSNTVTGVNNFLQSASDSENSVGTNWLTAFNSDGFTVANNINAAIWNLVSWTFREQPKFFDLVTWTGSGANRTIAHNLGSVPGCIIVKRLDAAANWAVYHRSLANTQYLVLNLADAAATGATWWNSTTPTSTEFSLGTNATVNASGGTYIAYVFAHDAGGFGLTGTDNVISCGSFTADGSGGCSVTLGYEPQWIMYKNTASDGWRMGDVMRGWSQTQWQYLAPNDANVETSLNNNPSYLAPTSTGFNTPTPGLFTAGNTFVYVAIRRGPMKVPTDATTVFTPVARSGTGSSTALTSPNIVTDMAWIKQRTGYDNPIDATRLIGPTRILFQNSTGAEVTDSTTVTSFASNVGYTVGTGSRVNASGSTYANWVFKRAAGFFDVVCYSGLPIDPGTIYHNLGVPPELIIVKRRNASSTLWPVYAAPLGVNTFAVLNSSSAVSSPFGYWGGTTPTSTYFNITQSSNTFESGGTFVAYLFATCAGVSKVGSYTGTGTLTTINCGFTAGARWVMIKRTDSTGSWYIWDTARGMVAGTDPSLMINDSEIEVNANSVYTIATGFQLLASPSIDVNTNGGSYIFLAIA